MQYVVDNYTEIAEAALIVPMDETQASEAAVGGRGSGRLRPLEGPPADTRAHGGSRHSSGRRGAGGEVPRRPPPPLGRGGDPRPAVPRRGDLGPDDDRGSSSRWSRSRSRSSRRSGRRSSPTPNGRRSSTTRSSGSGSCSNGTFLITGIAILVAIPLGLGSAVYLSEYATPAGAQGSSSRSSRCWSACRRSSSATSRSPSSPRRSSRTSSTSTSASSTPSRPGWSWGS